jgi:hypothetical protein
VIDHLLATPDIAVQSLTQPGVFYQYADRRSRSAGGSEGDDSPGQQECRDRERELRALRKEVVKQSRRSATVGVAQRNAFGRYHDEDRLVLAIVAIGEGESRCIWSTSCARAR